MTRFTIFLFLVALQTGHLVAQTAKDTIVVSQVNVELIEQLILNRINQERIKVGGKPLEYNTILFLAAKDQVQYCSSSGQLGHHQPNPAKATAKERVKFYGGKMRGTGENAAGIYILQPVKVNTASGKESTTTLHTYQQVADALVDLWMLSAVHKKNLLYNLFTQSGISVVVNPKTKSLLVVNVFGYE